MTQTIIYKINIQFLFIAVMEQQRSDIVPHFKQQQKMGVNADQHLWKLTLSAHKFHYNRGSK